MDRSTTHDTRRICLVTSEHLSMNPRLVKEADALHAAGYRVRVVSCQWLDWQRSEDARILETRGWRSQVVDFSRRHAPLLFWTSRLRHHLCRALARVVPGAAVVQRAVGRVVPEITRLAASESPDLFIGHNVAALPAAVLAGRACGVPVAFDAEDFHSGMWLSDRGPTLADRLAREVESRFLAGCRYVSAAAPLIAEAYVREYRIPSPTPILNVFPLAERPAEFRPTNCGGPLTLYWFSQVIGARRGLEEIIQAMGFVGTKQIQLHLRGQWQPGYEAQLRERARAAGLEPGQLVAHPPASPDQMVRLSAAYDVGLALEQPVSENRDICLTNKICTYLLAGNAVIASATRGQKRLMQEIPDAGLCCDVGDLPTLVGQLKRWELDRSRLESARRHAWELGGRKYNWDLESRKLLQLVEQAIGAPATAPS